jgi:hypothetical protein
LKKDILASDSSSISARANNNTAIQQELIQINQHYQDINADGIIRALATIDNVMFFVVWLPKQKI